MMHRGQARYSGVLIDSLPFKKQQDRQNTDLKHPTFYAI